MPRLRGYCGGAVDSIISVFTQLHWSGLKLELETLNKSIWHVVVNLRWRKDKINGCFKTALPCSPAMSKSSKVPKKWFWRNIEILANYFKGLGMFSAHIMNRKHC